MEQELSLGQKLTLQKRPDTEKLLAYGFVCSGSGSSIIRPVFAKTYAEVKLSGSRYSFRNLSSEEIDLS